MQDKRTIKGGLVGVLIALCLSISLAGCGDATEPQIPSVYSPETAVSYSEVDGYISQQMTDDDIPGLAVVVVQGDEVVYLKGFGVTSLGNPSPVTPQTIFELASISKSFTALGVLLLRDEGLIELDVPVQRYLPDLQINDPRAQPWGRPCRSAPCS